MDQELPDVLRGIAERHGWQPSHGLQVLSSAALVDRPFDPVLPLLVIPGSGAVGAATDPGSFVPAVLPGRHGHGTDPVAMLQRLYPADHPVLEPGGGPALTAGDLQADTLGSPRFLPALNAERSLAGPYGLPWLAARLRARDGCPWDREQDHRSLLPFLLEETYEVVDAVESGDPDRLAEELGDLLLQVVLHAQYGAEAGAFDLSDVYRGIMAKIIRRHPHVFGDVEAATSQDVSRNWEAIKAGERADAAAIAADRATDAARATAGPNGSAGGDASTKPLDPDMPAAFAGLSRSLPALVYASEMQERAAAQGYDWPDLEGVIDKIAEEAVELLGAEDDASRREEFGDLLFVIVNLGRKLNIDAEAALRGASRKMAARFAKVERYAAADGVQLRALGLDELDELWKRAKAQEREEADAMATGAV
ncbi:MAG: nucleoside triphosphate pyrophosphohydrolase [Chloroflexota bacterium]|nr:nucleoside triphosphate pyrophosphohydrolase [Chloroflexota bacterium]